MLVSSKKLLKEAQKKKAALGAFNAYNLETVKAIIEAAEELKAPVIVETTEKAITYAGISYLSSLVKKAAGEVNIPIVLHLDHGLSIEIIKDCLEAGYTSVMIDGSHLPFLQNIHLTKRVVEIAHRKNIPVEAELGTVTEHLKFTNPEEVSEFVKSTGIDSLACAIGSSHGIALEEKLDLELLSKIREKTDLPLVLHGASGVSDSDIKEAIKRGICKINIDTEIRKVFTQAVRETLKDKMIIDPREYLQKAKDETKKLVKEKIVLFGSNRV